MTNNESDYHDGYRSRDWEVEELQGQLAAVNAQLDELLTDMEVIAKLHENYENSTVGHRSTLLYSARCVARSAIDAAKGGGS